MSTTPNVGIYYISVSQKIQKSKANQSTSEGESLGRRFAPSLPTDSLLGSVLSVYLQRGLYASYRAAGPARWVSAGLQPMTHTNLRRNYVKTPRVAQVEQWPFFYPFHPKPQYSSTKNYHWNSGTMRIRYCGLEDMVMTGLLGVSVIERYAFCIVPPFHRRKNTPQSCGFGWNGSKNRNRSTRANISGVLV